MHKNIGDLAIAFAERQFIHDCLNKTFIEITAQELDSSEKLFAKNTPTNITVLVHGGGFLGSLWPQEEYRFRKILTNFNNHKIIVFPQTITFDTTTKEGLQYLNQSKMIYNSHPNIHICVRDTQSFNYLLSNFPEIETSLIPDMVLQLRLPCNNDSCGQTRKGVLMCMRDDHEKILSQKDEDTLYHLAKANFDSVTYTDMSASSIPSDIPHSENIVIEKAREFSSSKLVITDRLHGMILAALTGTPCIALNNSNRKVEAVYQWISSLEYITCVNDVNKVWDIFNSLNLEKSYKYDYNLTSTYFENLKNILLNTRS